jgi:hypothetical protein
VNAAGRFRLPKTIKANNLIHYRERIVAAMRYVLIPACILLLLLGCVVKVDRQSEKKQVEMARAACDEIVKRFSTELKGQLTISLADGGPANAVTVCNVKAPQIAAEFSTLPGLTVRRVSLRTRNPLNKPDRLEDSVLQAFARSPLDEPQIFTLMSRDSSGIRMFRYMKEIKAGAICLNCHGNRENFSDDLKKVLSEKYPYDEATGYNINESRGAYSVTALYPDAAKTLTRILSENGK